MLELFNLDGPAVSKVNEVVSLCGSRGLKLESDCYLVVNRVVLQFLASNLVRYYCLICMVSGCNAQRQCSKVDSC